MLKKDFSLILKYIGDDAFFYLIVKKNKGLSPSDLRIDLFNKINILPNNKVIRLNVNYLNESCISFQNIPNDNKCNALLVRSDILLDVLGDYSLVNYYISQKIIFIQPVELIIKQSQRKVEKEKKIKQKKNILMQNIQSINNGNSKSLTRKEWVEANEDILKNKSTSYEKIVYNKLRKTFKNRVKAQSPFIINGNIYYADICIKCKRIIIEIDGGYHNLNKQKIKDSQRDKDFASIGYTTIRIKNEDVNRNTLKELISNILNIPNIRKPK